MTITVRFEAQLRQAFGKDRVDLPLTEMNDVTSVFSQLAEQCSSEFSSRIVDQSGVPLRSLLVFLNDQPVPQTEFHSTQLSAGDVMTIFSPIAGG